MSANKIYVGNIAYGVTDDMLNQAFSEFGTVESAEVKMDRMTGRSRGFGFVVMSTAEEAAEAISNLNGKDLDGRALRVSEARAETPRRGGGGFGGGGGGGGRDRGGFGGGGGGGRDRGFGGGGRDRGGRY
ncbi:MAG: RNA-binding protein [Bradymonadales bacterium]|nr:MAG: RNA-binding protein [Bradymonadales bacterium]